MNVNAKDGWPLTLTRKIEDFPIANVSLRKLLEPAEFEKRLATCRYPWDLLSISEEIIGAMDHDEILGEIHQLAVVDGHLKLGRGSKILPGVFIEGNVVIGENCKIGPNCYIRGNTSIGDACHIGQSVEIKNSIILVEPMSGTYRMSEIQFSGRK